MPAINHKSFKRNSKNHEFLEDSPCSKPPATPEGFGTRGVQGGVTAIIEKQKGKTYDPSARPQTDVFVKLANELGTDTWHGNLHAIPCTKQHQLTKHNNISLPIRTDILIHLDLEISVKFVSVKCTWNQLRLALGFLMHLNLQI